MVAGRAKHTRTMQRPHVWLRLGIATVLALPLLWLSLAVSVNGIYERVAPEQAVAWWPWSANATANLAGAIATDPSPSQAHKSAVLARQALVRQALQPAAIRSLALTTIFADPSGQQARRLMSYGEKVSRRDVPTQLWLIEDSVQHGDVANALVHYDRALRTSQEIRAEILPVLVAAVNDPKIAKAFMPFVERGSSWREDFVSRMVSNVDNPVALAMLLPVAGLSLNSSADRNLIQLGLARIATRGAPDTAWHLYRRMGGRAPGPGQLLVNGDLSAEPKLEPFDWSMNTDPALATNRETHNGQWRLHASLTAGANGWVARQLVRLPQGRYALTTQIIGSRDGSTLGLIMRCATNRSDDVLFMKNWDGEKATTGEVTLNNKCPIAWISFEGRGALDNGPSEYWIGPISIRKTK